jgi:hypothetical protein
MKLINKGAVAAVSVAALVTMAPAAHASSTTTLRSGDVDTSDTRANGHVEFLKDGLHVWTDGNSDTGDNGNNGTWNTDKAAGYFAFNDTLAAVAAGTAPSMAWYGTSGSCVSGAEPGLQLAFDKDGNGTWDGFLVGEKVYGGDWWGSNANLQNDPSSPTVGGGGSPANGTLSDWATAFPNGKIIGAGFSLGSGCYGDGIIRSITIDGTSFGFTSEAATTVVPVTGTASVKTVVHPHATVLRAHFVTDALGANEVQGAKLRFRVTDNGKDIYRNRMGAGQRSAAKFRFAQGTGKHVVQVLKNGVVDSRTVIKTGR